MGQDKPQQTTRRVSSRGIAVAVTVAVVLGGAAVGLAATLNSPVGAGGRDAPAMPASVPEAREDENLANLPPLALVLNASLPADIAALPPEQQITRLEARAARSGSIAHLLELGSGQQQIDDQAAAARTYQRVLDAEPGNTAALAGLAMATARTGGTIAEAGDALDALAAAHPEDQTVVFNHGWVAFYRLDGPSARAAFERALELGPTTRLGRTAQALLAALDEGALSQTP